MCIPKANIVEIFKGIQGEGIYLGELQIFVRFAGCNLSCKHCDTDYALNIPKICRIEYDECIDNPISSVDIIDIIKKYPQIFRVSITGGEPLLQVEYLKIFLPLLKKEGYNVYLETNSTLPEQLAMIIDWIDIISADIKLPSFTGNTEIFVDKHAEFLNIAQAYKKNIFVKVVVTEDTTIEEIKTAIDIIMNVDKNIPLIIQPLTKPKHTIRNYDQLLQFIIYALEKLYNVRLIPQIHKVMNWR
jgi:organic radical activating enzyme